MDTIAHTDIDIMFGSGPFYMTGNTNGENIGIMMVHGLDETAADFRTIANSLNETEEYRVHLPLLPGFGLKPEELKNVEIPQWKAYINRELDLLKGFTEYQFIGGHGLGGLLALIKAQKVDVDGIFCISTPINVKGFENIINSKNNAEEDYVPVDSELFKVETNNEWVGYDKIPVNIIPKIRELISEMKSGLSQIKAPIILFQGKEDNMIEKNSMDYIYENIGSKIKEKVWLEHNDHEVLESSDEHPIAEKLDAFIQKIVQHNKKTDKN
ncbi:MAG: alpha/beta hydrolase [Candidatus Lokiarchaeota archaeon]